MTSDETALAVRAQQDTADFGLLYDHFFARVFNYCRYRCDDDAAADDLAARVFERVLTGLDRFDPDRGPSSASDSPPGSPTARSQLRPGSA